MPDHTGEPTPADDAERVRRGSEERYRKLFEDSVVGVFRRTLDGVLLEVNEAYARMFGFDSPITLLGTSVDQLYLRGEDRQAFQDRLERDGSVRNCELELQRQDGSRIWVLENATLVLDPVLEEEVVTGTLVEITERKLLAAELERMAYQDPLTGLANRRALQQEAGRILAFADRHGVQAGLVYIDLTRFKRINDTLGHSVGDEVLVEIAGRLRRRARESDLVARIGGDEFAVLLAEVGGEEGALAAAERLAAGLEPPIEVANTSLHVGAKLGIGLYPDHAEDFPGLLRAADRAMYQAKARERALSIYTASEGPPQDDRVLEKELRKGLVAGHLLLHYQPILQVRDGVTVAAEALVRWDHPKRGLLTAGEFLPRVAGTRLIRELDRWVLENAARQLREWKNATNGPRWVAVNIAPTTLADPNLGAELEELLGGSAAGQGLVLEVADQIAAGASEDSLKRLRGLRDLGIGVALAAFGAGPGALARLKEVPADMLKIGGHFLEDPHHSPERRTLVEAVVKLGQALGLTIVMERVEWPAQEEWTRAAGCDLAQGFYLGRPVPPEKIGRV